MADSLNSLNVLLVTDLFPPYVGGVPVHQWELAKGLQARGHQVHVVTARLPGTLPNEDMLGVQVHRVGPADRIARLGFAVRAVGPARRLARRADVVQASTFVGAGPGSAAGVLGRVPVVLTVHEVFREQWRQFLPSHRVKATALRAAEWGLLHLPYRAVVAVSAYTQQRLVPYGWGPGASIVIQNGIDEAFWHPGLANPGTFRQSATLDDRFLFLFFGRAGISKGLPTLLTAYERSGLGSTHLALVLGPGELETWCRQRIQGSPFLREHVLVLDPLGREALRNAIADADAVVLPSLSEGFGLAHAEACAMGRPVISSATGPIPEVVGGRRWLVAPGDATALADAMASAVRGEWERVPVHQFSWRDTVLAYEDVLRRAVD